MTAPPRPSPAFSRHLDRVAGDNIIQFPAVVTRTLPVDDCSGPAFAPRQPTQIDWAAVCIAIGISLTVGAGIILFGLAGVLAAGWQP